jgi:hypothetical protein
MNLEEIKANAPPRSNFYLRSDPSRYIHCEGGNWYEWVKDHWQKVHPLNMIKIRDDLRRLHPWK